MRHFLLCWSAEPRKLLLELQLSVGEVRRKKLRETVGGRDGECLGRVRRLGENTKASEKLLESKAEERVNRIWQAWWKKNISRTE